MNHRQPAHRHTAAPPPRPAGPPLPLDQWVRRLLGLWRQRRPSRGARPRDWLAPDELAALRNSLRGLTHGLGTTRALAGAHYLEQPESLGAYLLYFWPVSYAQVAYALLQAGFTPARPPARALDLGCGPGPATAALLDAGAREVVAADRSPAALDALRQLAGDDARRVTLRVWDAHQATPPLADNSFDCIVVGHLLNELWRDAPDRVERRTALLRALLPALTPAGVLIVIEPALHHAARELLAVRDGLLDAGAWIHAPCTLQGACPALRDDRATCHTEVAWQPPRLLQDIAAEAGPHREALKMAWLVARREPLPDAPADLLRVVSDPLLNKAGRLRMLVCGAGGRFALSAHPRDAHAAVRTFLGLRRGDLIRVWQPEPRGEAWGVGEETVITVVAAPPAAPGQAVTGCGRMHPRGSARVAGR